MLSAAMESAKHGEDALTLRLTRSLLRREPFSTQGMMLRGCALMNAGRMREASRLFGRLSGLLLEDTVSQALYRMARDGERPAERLTLGTDVPREEAARRAAELVAALYEDAAALRGDDARRKALCQLSAWAFRSVVAGPNMAVVAMILMSGIDAPDTREVLLDALTDPQIADSFKLAVLQSLTAREGFAPYDVDMEGRLVRLAAGGATQRPAGLETGQDVVQRAADALMPEFPGAPQALLPLYIQYLNVYGVPGAKEKDACAAALEWTYHHLSGHPVDLATVCGRYGASRRLCRMIARRLLGAADRQQSEDEER